MDDSITLSELIGEGEYIESPMEPDHFDTLVDDLGEGTATMTITLGTTQVEVTIEHLSPEKMREKADRGEPILVDVRGANCGFKMYPDPDFDSESTV